MNSQILRKIIFAGLFAVPFIPFLVSGTFYFPYITPKAFAFRLIIEFVLAAWVLLAIFEPAYRPKRTIILYAVAGFLAVVGLADIFGVAPLRSFWSNFERMEGYVALLHFGALFLVMGSVFKEADWKKWWNFSLMASGVMALYSLTQVLGVSSTGGQADFRVDGTFGNPIYLAVYMLFHIFIALLFMLRERKSTGLRWSYGVLAALEIVVLYYTATRGAVLGLIGGLVIVALLGIFNKNPEERVMRKAGAAVLVSIALLIGGFFAFRDAPFMTQNPILVRFSSLTFSELKTQGRYFVWPIAYKGWQEKPVLGWGQDNFNYVFEKHYVPEMHRLEPWFDRAHNIFLDWMVSAGSLGILAYLSLYGTLLYIVWRKSSLSWGEKSVITGLAAAYFFHNFFVFDHQTSYVLFFSLLAYVHFKGSGAVDVSKGEKSVSGGMLFGAVVALAVVVWFINIPPLIGNSKLLNALASVHQPEPNSIAAVENFRSAYEASYLGRQEVTEQLASIGIRVLTDESLSIEQRNEFFDFAARAVAKQADDYPKNGRSQLIAGGFLSATGQFDAALMYLGRARELMPGKQQVYGELANVLAGQGRYDDAIAVLTYLGEISPDHKKQVDESIQQLRSRQ